MRRQSNRSRAIVEWNFVVALLALVLASPAPWIQFAGTAEALAPTQSPGFGVAGDATWRTTHAPSALTGSNDAGEPTVGIVVKDALTRPWGDVMFQSFSRTFRVQFVENGNATWVLTPGTRGPINLDPILHTIESTGRTIAGGLAGPCALVQYTDNAGDTWTNVRNACAASVDKESFGSGPWRTPIPGGVTYPVAVYYCAQNGGTGSCSVSPDGGITYGPPTLTVPLTSCGALHGHPEVSTTGVVMIPNMWCGAPDKNAVIYSKDNGVTWAFQTTGPNSEVDSDPAIATTPDDGIYFAYQATDPSGGSRVCVSRSVGVGAGAGISWNRYDGRCLTGAASDTFSWTSNVRGVTNTGGSFDPTTIKNVAFVQATAGDADRAAVAFLGTSNAAENAHSDAPFAGTWYMYVAVTYDGGATWTLYDVDPGDAVQHQLAICTEGIDCSGSRNLLDFNDLETDTQGRIVVGYADGCHSGATDDCPGGGAQEWATITRLQTGRGLYAAFDADAGSLVADAGAARVGAVGQTITFTGSAFGGVPPYAFAWDLDNDGVYDDATGPVAATAFATTGTHVVGLQVTDSDSPASVATDTTTATISDSGGVPVVAITNPSDGASVQDEVLIRGTAGSDGGGGGSPLSFAGIQSASLAGTTATLAWSPASGGTPPYTYSVFRGASGAIDFGTVVVTTTGTSVDVAGLAPGLEACFAVRVTDSDNDSDANTVERCVTPELDEETIVFYYHGGEPVDAPDPAPDGALHIAGTMDMDAGTSPRSAFTGGPVQQLGVDLGLTALNDVVGRYGATFITEPLPSALTVSGGVRTSEDLDGLPWDVAAGALLKTCIANNVGGVFLADVFLVEPGDSAIRVLENAGKEFAPVFVPDTTGAGACGTNQLSYVDGGTSATFPAGSRILVGLNPDVFLGSATTQLNWDGAGIHDSHLELLAVFGGGGSPPPPSPGADPEGDANSPETDVIALGATATSSALVVDIDLAAFVTPDTGGPAGREAYIYNVYFDHDGLQHEFEVYTGLQTSFVFYYQKAGGEGDCDGCIASFDYAASALRLTIPWGDISTLPAPGEPISNLYVQTYQAVVLGIVRIVADDRAPDEGGRSLVVPSSSLGGETAPDGSLVLHLHGESVQPLGLWGLGTDARAPAGLLAGAPHRLVPTLHHGGSGMPLVAETPVLDAALDLAEGEAVAELHVSSGADASVLVTELNAVTSRGIVPIARTETPLTPTDRATLVAVPLTIPAEVVLAAGDRLQLKAWTDSPSGVWSVAFDSPLYPSRLTLPIGLASEIGALDADPEGERMLNADDPAELPPTYASMDIRNVFVTNDATGITATFALAGFDPASPMPGSSAPTWEYKFDYTSAGVTRTLGVWIEGAGASNPVLQGTARCLSCGGGLGWGVLANGFPVTVDGATIRTTVPFSAFAGADTGAFGPGSVLTKTHAETRAVIGVLLATIDRAPGGNTEEIVLGLVGGATCCGNDYLVKTGTVEDVPPSIESFSVDVAVGDAPLDVTFSGEVNAGTNPIDTVSLDPGDGSGSFPVTLAGDGTFSVGHTYATVGVFTATLTAADTEGLDDTATQLVTTTRQPGVEVRVGSGPVELATDTSIAGDWSEWELPYDFGAHAPGTELQIEAVYFDGSLESAAHTITVTVVAGGQVQITSPADGSFVDPSPDTLVEGTTTDATGAGASSGMWEIPYVNDVDGDRVMDALEELLASGAATDVYDVRVLLDRAATMDDALQLVTRGHASSAEPLWIIDAVDLEDVPGWAVLGLLEHEGAVHVEWLPPAVQHSGIGMQTIKALRSTTYGDACVFGAAGCLGYTGAGIGYANFDAGVHKTHVAFNWGPYAPPGMGPGDSKMVAVLDAWGQGTTGNHATATASAAVATGLLSGSDGLIIGSAPGAHLVNVIALQEIGGPTGNSVSTRTCQAVQLMLNNRVAHNIRVASLSYSSVAPLAGSDDACVNNAVDQGVVMVIAAGNTAAIGSPSTAAKAITVGNQDDLRTASRLDDTPCHGVFVNTAFAGACGVSGSVTAGTQTVGKPEVSAPGVCMTLAASSSPTANGACGSGTSYSAPVVAGVVALMFEANPDLTPAEVEEILMATAHLGDAPPTGVWMPSIGAGWVDAYLAVQEAASRFDADLAVAIDAPGPGSPGVPIQFSAAVTGGQAPYSYLWNFGDLSTSTAAAPSHAYASAGSYTVTLTVTDSALDTAQDEAIVLIADGIGVGISSPSENDVVSGDVVVAGTASFPPPSTEFDVGAPLWTDPAGDASLLGAANLDTLDIRGVYAWGDDGPADPEFNLGLTVTSLPDDQSGTEYARYRLFFIYNDMEYLLRSHVDAAFSAQNADPTLTPHFALFKAAPGSTSFPFVADITGTWDGATGLVAFNVPKTLVQDAAGIPAPAGATLTGLRAQTTFGAVNQNIATIDASLAPPGTTVTVGPQAGGDPQVLVTFGGLGTKVATGTTSWTTSFDTTLGNDGPATITAIATDGASSSAPVAIQVVVDNGASEGVSVTIDSPLDGATVSGDVAFGGTVGDGVGGSSASAIQIAPLGPAGAAPAYAGVHLFATGPVTEWILDWGDGTLERGVGDPTGHHSHLYTAAGDHVVRIVSIGPGGDLAVDELPMPVVANGDAQPGPANPTLFFHMWDDPATPDTLITDQFVNADIDDPMGNVGGVTSGGVGDADGAEVWSMKPAPTSTLFLVPGGMGSATFNYQAPADVAVTVEVDVMVDGIERATGSAMASFVAMQATTVNVPVRVNDDWDGTIGAGAAVSVVTKYRALPVAGGPGWAGIRGFNVDQWSLTLPWTSSSGGGGGGGPIDETLYYAHDVEASWSACHSTGASLKTTYPFGQNDLGRIFFDCRTGTSLVMQTAPLAEGIAVSSDEASEFTVFLGGTPFADIGVVVQYTATIELGTGTQPTKVGTASATFTGVTNGLTGEFAKVVLMVQPTSDVPIAAGEVLRARLMLSGVGGLGSAPYSQWGGGEVSPYTLLLKTVADVELGQVTGLAATAGDGSVALSWDAVPDAAAYNVYRDGALLAGGVTQASYTDLAVTNGVTYEYRVSATLGASEGPLSVAVQATPTSGSDLPKVELSIRRASDSLVVLPTTPATLAGSSWSHSWDSTGTPSDGAYIATATYTATSSETATASITVNVNNVVDVDPPTVTLAADPTTADVGEAIAFSATLGGGPATSIDWVFGDGTLLAGGSASESHAYATEGAFTATVTVSNEAGSASDSVLVHVVDPDKFVDVRIFAEGATPGAEDGWARATGTGPAGALSEWEFPWGTSALRGRFVIEARFFDGSQMSTTASSLAIVDAAPSAALAADPATADAATPVTLDGSGSSAVGGTIATFRFDPGDGSGAIVGAAASVQHTYAAPGVYTASLVVTDDLGRASAPATADVTVENLPPQAAISGPGIGQELVPVGFDGSGSTDPDPIPAGGIVDYTWLVDGVERQTGAGHTFSHSFPDQGAYTVTLAVTDALGATDSADHAIDIANNPPTASLSVTPASAGRGVERTLDGSASAANGASGAIVEYVFDPDGSGPAEAVATTSSSITHTYADVGVFDATLQVRDEAADLSQVDSFQVSVVNTAPVLDPIGDRSVKKGQLLAFDVTASDADALDVLTLAMDGATLPPAATFVDNGDGTGTFSWQTEISDLGTYSVRFAVDDGLATDEETIDIDVVEVTEAAINARTGVLHDTIQDAIDAAAPGDKILLAHGAYEESVTIPVEGLVLCQWNLDPAEPDCGSDPEDVVIRSTTGVGISVLADDVTIKDFTILVSGDSGDGFAYGINVGTNAGVAGLQVLGNIIQPDTAAGEVNGESGVRGRMTGALIDGNEIAGWASGVFLRPYGGDNTVSGNFFTAVGSGVATWSPRTLVEGNTFTGSILYGVDVAEIQNDPTTNADGNVLRDNDLSGATRGVRIRGSGTGAAEGVTVDARLNDWGAYDHRLIPGKLDNTGATNQVEFLPFRDADGAPEPPLVKRFRPGVSPPLGAEDLFLGIQDAIDEPGTAPGTKIHVQVGRRTPYLEAVDVHRPGVTLCGTISSINPCVPEQNVAAGQTLDLQDPVIDATGLGAPAITVRAADVEIEGFTLKGSSPLLAATSASGLHVLGNAFHQVQGASATQGLRIASSDGTTIESNSVLGNLQPGSVAINFEASAGAVVADNVVSNAGAAIRLAESTDGVVQDNLVLITRQNPATTQSLGVSLHLGSGHTTTGNVLSGTGIGLLVGGATGVASERDQFVAGITGIELRASGASSTQPAGFVVHNAWLTPTQTAMRLAAGTMGLAVDAECNDWGAYNAVAITGRIEDQGALNTVDFQPFVAPNEESAPLGCLTAPMSSFVPADVDVARDQTVEFTDTSTPGSKAIVRWEWDFGDGMRQVFVRPPADTSHSYPAMGSYTVRLKVTDVDGMTSTAFGNVDVVNILPAFGPVQAVYEILEGLDLTIDVGATDGDGDPVSLGLEPLPDGSSFDDHGDGTGRFRWTPAFDDSGSYAMTLSASDGFDTVTRPLTVVVLDANRAPVLAPIGNQFVLEEILLTFDVTATDPDGDAIGLEAAPLPAGASFVDNGGGTGTFTWTPTIEQQGNYQVTFTASDGALSDAETIFVTVGNVNRPPSLTPIGDRTVLEGQVLSITVSGSDPDGDALTYAVPQRAPGSVWNAAARTLTWKPSFSQAGTYPVTFTVRDASLTASQSITVTVLDANRAPAIAPIPAQTVAVRRPLSFTVSVSDPDGTLVGVSIQDAPAGSAFNTATRVFAWTPEPGQEGVYTVTFAATDGVATTAKPVQITVTANQPPVVVLAAPGVLELDETGTFAALAFDPEGTARSYAWDFDASDGIDVDATTATVEHSYPTVGPRDVTLVVTDADGYATTVTHTVTVDDHIVATLDIAGAAGQAEDGTYLFTDAADLLAFIPVAVQVEDDTGAAVAAGTVAVAVTYVGLEAENAVEVEGDEAELVVIDGTANGFLRPIVSEDVAFVATTIAWSPGLYEVSFVVTAPSRDGGAAGDETFELLARLWIMPEPAGEPV